MSAESYTRWHSNPSDEDDDDDENEDEDAGGRVGRGGTEAVTIVSSPSGARPRHLPDLTPAAQTRVICIMMLGGLVCMVVGVCIGRAWGHTAIHHTINHIIPASETHHYNASRLLRNLQPQLILDYMRRLDDTPKELLAEFVESVWQAQGLLTSSTHFTVQLSKPDTEHPNTVEVTYNDNHTEVLNPLPHTVESPPFSAYSAAGVVTGTLVYGHYGRREDLATLQSLKINLKGAILLLRHGKLHDGAKLHNAEQAGAGGVLLYPDPADLRGVRRGGDPYPNGTGLPDDGVIWGSLSKVPGDPATPFLPSLDHVYRKELSEQPLAKIPGQSVSGEVAKRLLTLVGGPMVPGGWRGDLGVTYKLGGSWAPNSRLTNLTLTVNNVLYQETIRNIHATMPAADQTKVIMMGCHYGSLYSSSSAGLGAMLALSDALSRAYLPKGTHRKVVFSAWAAGQQGMIGSTEFTQLHSWWVDTSMMAYLSLDEVLRGTGSMRVKASPTLREVIRQAATQVSWPIGEDVNVRDGWRMSDPLGKYDVHFSSLGSGSDFVSFTAQRGVPSAHFTAMGEEWWSTYSLRHSQYDTLETYTQLLDPGCKWTHMLASLVGSVMVMMSQSEVPPVLLNELSGELYNGWQRFLHLHTSALTKSGYNFTSILDAIEEEIVTLDESLKTLQAWYDSRLSYVRQYPSSFPGPAYFRQVEQRVRLLADLERGLLGPRGVQRTFTTNLMVGPDPEDPVRATHFPHASQAITHALQQKIPWENVHQELSYILAALASYRQLFPVDLPSHPEDATE